MKNERKFKIEVPKQLEKYVTINHLINNYVNVQKSIPENAKSFLVVK